MKFDSIKEFVRNHKAEIVALSIAAAAAAVVVHFRMKDYVEITDIMIDEMSTGDATRFIHKGIEYSLAMQTYTP